MQGAGEEAVFALTLDGIEVVLAQAQQGQVALEASHYTQVRTMGI
jgi:hypothetical protein